MEQKFEGKSAVEYFLQYSKESIEICYEYFKTLKVSDEKKQKLFCIEKEAVFLHSVVIITMQWSQAQSYLRPIWAVWD